MYLKKLYKQSRMWFVIIVLFVFTQLFLDYKNGIELSPVYHYGMFSVPYHFTPTYQCNEIRVNGTLLQTKDFTPNGWDNIVIPIIQYNRQLQWNSEVYNQSIRRLLHIRDSSLYTFQLSQAEFDAWYRRRILHLLDIKDSVTDVRYTITNYKLENGVLVK